MDLGVHYAGFSHPDWSETLQICGQMWSDDNGAFTGEHYTLAETICVPPPLQRPGPPIMIGGGGERRTLRLVAKYADACNLFAESPEVVSHKLDVLRGHCEAEAREHVLPRLKDL